MESITTEAKASAAIEPEGTTPAPAPAATAPAAPKTSLVDRVKALLNGTSNADLHAQLRTITGERDTERNRAADLEAKLTAERNKVAGLEQQLADIESALNAQKQVVKATATEIAGSLGVSMEQLPAPRGEEATSKTKTFAQWRAMSPYEQLQFSKAGGTIEG